MKDFKTFLNEQKRLVEAKGPPAFSPKQPRGSSSSPLRGYHGGGADKVGVVASLGHGNDIHKVLVAQGTSPSFMSNVSDKAVYDFSKMIGNFEKLDKLVMGDEDKNRMKSIIDSMSDSTQKRQLIKNMDDIVGLPKSADRTERTQSIVNQIKQYDMEARGVGRDAAVPSTFIPHNNASWSNR